jgi:hypothetical protein
MSGCCGEGRGEWGRVRHLWRRSRGVEIVMWGRSNAYGGLTWSVEKVRRPDLVDYVVSASGTWRIDWTEGMEIMEIEECIVITRAFQNQKKYERTRVVHRGAELSFTTWVSLWIRILPTAVLKHLCHLFHYNVFQRESSTKNRFKLSLPIPIQRDGSIFSLIPLNRTSSSTSQNGDFMRTLLPTTPKQLASKRVPHTPNHAASQIQAPKHYSNRCTSRTRVVR